MSGLSFTQVKPSAALAPCIEFFWLLQNSTSLPVYEHLVFPDGGMDLVVPVRTDGASAGHTLFVSGIASSARNQTIEPRSALVGARFRAGRHYGLIPIVGSALRDEVAPFADLAKNNADRWCQLVEGAECPSRIVKALDAWLSSIAPRIPPTDRSIFHSIRDIEESRGTIRLAQLEESGINGRQLRRKFDKYVGLSPKRFCRILRLSHLVDLARETPDTDWADIALQCGYYDQSHMIEEFLELTCTTPQKYFSTVTPVRFFQYPTLAAL